LAARPRISKAPRLAAMNASPVIQAGNNLPDHPHHRASSPHERSGNPTA
jgi:hypothetical protein